MRFKVFLHMFLILALFAPVHALLAQAAPGGDDAGTLLNAILALILGSAFNGVVATALTSVFKRIPFLLAVPAQYINAAVVALLVVATAGFTLLGYEAQWRQFLDLFGTVVPPILAVLFPTVVSGLVYSAAKQAGTPLLGYARTP